MREYLRRADAWSDAREHALQEDCEREVDAAVADYLRVVPPSTDAMFDSLFAALPARLRDQRR